MGQIRHITSEAIILKTSVAREIDRYFYFISPELGITCAIAYGASKIKSRFCSTVQPFVNAKLFLYRPPKFTQLKLEDISDVISNEFIKNNINYIYLASFYSEVILNCYLSSEEYKAHYYLLKYSYELLKKNNGIIRSFLFFICKFFFLHGYNFRLDSCMKCGGKFEKYFFDYSAGGIFCENHSDHRTSRFILSGIAANLFNMFLNRKYIELTDIEINCRDFNMIFPIAINSVKRIFEKNLKTLDSILKILSDQ